MASRTYLPTLVYILEKVCKYISNYRTQILVVISTENAAKLDAVVTACNALVEVLNAFIPTGT